MGILKQQFVSWIGNSYMACKTKHRIGSTYEKELAWISSSNGEGVIGGEPKGQFSAGELGTIVLELYTGTILKGPWLKQITK